MLNNVTEKGKKVIITCEVCGNLLKGRKVRQVWAKNKTEIIKKKFSVVVYEYRIMPCKH